MTYVSYEITQQPYYYYVQYLKFNVIGGVITLTFDAPPSNISTDYLAIAKGGTLSDQFQFGFSTVDGSLAVSGNTAALTMPVVIENNVNVYIYYQGAQLPFFIRARVDLRYIKPAIFDGFPLKL